MRYLSLSRAGLLACLALVLLVSTSVAAASSGHQTSGNDPKYLAPPGNPAVSQYLEVVPNAMGSAPPGSGGNPPSSSSGTGSANSISPAERKKLDRLGPDGKALANVVQSTAPPAPQSAASNNDSSGALGGKSSSNGGNDVQTSGSAGQSDSGSLSSSGSQSPVSAVLSAAAGQGGGGGVGILLPLLMGAGVLTVLFAVLRRRTVRRP